MAKLTINIPTPRMNRIINAYAINFARPDTVDDGRGNQIPNPETKQAFFKRMLIQKQIKKVVKSVEGSTAARLATIEKQTEIDNFDIT